MDARAFLDGAVPPAPPAPTPPKTMGRPSEYDEDKAMAICERIASGETLRTICDKDDFPSRSTVFRWLLGNEVFAAQYKAALYWRAESRADEIIEIADDTSQDWATMLSEEGVAIQKLNKEAISRSKLRIDTRWRLMAKEAPKKYGDLPPEEPPPTPKPEDARVVTEAPPLLENDPLVSQVQAWDKASKEPVK